MATKTYTSAPVKGNYNLDSEAIEYEFRSWNAGCMYLLVGFIIMAALAYIILNAAKIQLMVAA